MHSATAAVSVVSTIRPLQFIAAAIVGDTGSTSAIENNSHSAHNITLSPGDRLKLDQADLLLWIGPEFEIYLADLFSNSADESSRITASELPGLTLHTMSNGQSDPHLWLDPDNALLIARHLKESLAEKFPQQAAQYQQNFEAFQQQLASRWQEIETSLANSRQLPYAVYHNAYSYFEQALGMSHRLVLLDNPEVQPGMRDVLRIRQALSELGPSCIILEPDSSAALVDTLVAESSPALVTIDLLGFDITASASAYLDLLDEVAGGFQACLTSF